MVAALFSSAAREEQRRWKREEEEARAKFQAELDASIFKSSWYRAVGAGMGATLNAANAMEAYVLADRASWLNFKNKKSLKLLFSGDPVLFNQYTYIQINPAKHKHVHNDQAQQLENWLVSPKAQRIIADYKIAGQQLFTPNAK